MLKCNVCKGENIYFSKKNKQYICEDCGNTFKMCNEQQKVFFSYAHDRYSNIVEEVFQSLCDSNYEIWKDTASIKGGDDWRREITLGIKSSSVVVAFITQKSIRDPGVCLDELQIAVAFHKPVIPIRLENVELPSSINYFQWIDCFSIDSNELEKCIIECLQSDRNFDKEINELKNILKPTEFDVKLQLLASNSHIIREKLLLEVDRWMVNGSKIMCLLGNPGTGKSVFSSQLYFNRSYVDAIYFCQWDKSREDELSIIIKSISFQIALRNPDYRIFISKCSINESEAPTSLFETLIINPLNLAINGEREPKIVIIDALDELRSKTVYDLMNLVYSNLNRLPNWLRFVFNCRINNNFIRYFNNCDTTIIKIENEFAIFDIERYVILRLDKFTPKKRKAFAEEIAKKSKGVFLYAVEAIKDVISGIIPNEEDLPSGMNAFYCGYFERCTKENISYSLHVEPILGIIIESKESVSPLFISKVLHLDLNSVLKVLRKFSDYFIIIGEDERAIVKSFHKSIIDWILELQIEDKFYVNLKKANNVLIDYGINCVNIKEYFDEYYVENFYNKFIKSGRWKDFSHDWLMQMYIHLIKSAIFVGNTQIENATITLLNNNSINDCEKIEYLSRRLNYETRNAPNLINKTINEMEQYLTHIIDSKKRIRFAIEIAVGYFYAGNNYGGLSLLEKMENLHQKEIQQDAELNSQIKHTYGLLSHDIDKNEKVVESSKHACNGYFETKRMYEYYISLVNLYDGYMGSGSLRESFNTIKELDLMINEDTSLQIKDIHNICKANAYLSGGRIMTSLHYYEIGIGIAQKIGHTWDYLYAKIWRNLALAYYGEKDCLVNLYEIFNQLGGDEYIYLKSLSATFYFVATYLLKEKNINIEKELFFYVSSTNFNGHIALVNAVIHLQKIDFGTSVQNTINQFLKCEGIKGGFTVAYDFYNQCANKNVQMQEWIKKYIAPIYEYQQKEKASIIQSLDKTFFVKSFNCCGCQAMCCYDGVYVSPNEEKNIIDFVDANKDLFSDLPDHLVIDSNWENTIVGRKTDTRPYNYTNPCFPKHFNQTRCIFAREDGFCQLQKIATQQDLHPWKIKPQSCWMFPLDIDGHNQISPPPKSVKEDPNYIVNKYAGYVSALPCGQRSANGVIWTDCYYNEIEYYYFLMHNK